MSAEANTTNEKDGAYLQSLSRWALVEQVTRRYDELKKLADGSFATGPKLDAYTAACQERDRREPPPSAYVSTADAIGCSGLMSSQGLSVQ